MNDGLIHLFLLVHFAATLFMTGVIWFVQVVHYPLFASIGDAEFSKYQKRHTSLTTWVVGPAMSIEGVTGLLLLWLRPTGVAVQQLWAGVALLAVIWISTAVVQVPCHRFLSQEFDSGVHRRLVRTNWIRTTLWSLRGLLVLCMAWSASPRTDIW